MSLLLEQYHQQNQSLLSAAGNLELSIAFFRIKSMRRRKRNGDKMHPCLAPVSTLKNSELPFLVFIQQLLFKYMFLVI